MGEKSNKCMILVGKKSIFRWVDNIRMDLRKGGVVWTGLIWIRIGTSGGGLL
jgi:hypothetical protein